MRVAGLSAALLLVLALLLAWVIGPQLSVPESPGVQTLTWAQALLEPDGLAPQQAQVTLRHRWDSAFPGHGGRARYTLTVPDSTVLDGQALGLYLERAGNQTRVTLNGVQLQQ